MEVYSHSKYQSPSTYDYLSDKPQEKKTPVVRDSMISTVSEAFEFEDFLGETTVLKDRVPKNKANKSIVHFSREVGEDSHTTNPLFTINLQNNYQRRSTFADIFGNMESKPKQQNQDSSAIQTPRFECKFDYNTISYDSNNGRQNHSSISSGLNFRDKNPSIPNSYVKKYNYSLLSNKNNQSKDSRMNSAIKQNSKPYSYQPNSFKNGNKTTAKYFGSKNGNNLHSSNFTNVFDQYSKDFTNPNIMDLLHKKTNSQTFEMRQMHNNVNNNWNTSYY